MVWWLRSFVRKGQQPPWIVPDELWARIEPQLPAVPRRADHPGRRRLDDRKVLSGILFVLYTGIPLAVSLTGGQRNDITQLMPLIAAIPPIRGRRYRPRQRP